ncbi:response regulator transcription factor [Xenorhabdus szentirmaii]|nr:MULTISPECIES: response regulator transcription factor [Xenorhabdus]MBD2803244.1 response regulator transcription factor [Xenorhabdus sp. ZM]MBD2821910.1 response regulator transcription factor [Xenorhabdus sp. 42]MBD2825542.1 response regulator transcription factor [Xenorhabdus sp. 5]MBD2781895.1 response regulator transcription factor [Xenorhabdus sp. 38]MBD2792122.1 response regulator transcription factor [Xenorhabdus sp. CUL]
MKIKVTLIDDHVIARSGFAQLLRLENDITVVGQYSSAREALPDLLKKKIDIVIMDISMPNESGLQIINQLRLKRADFNTIIISIYGTASLVQKALDSGVRGYLTKYCKPEDLMKAIRLVHQGKTFLCTDALKSFRQKTSEIKELDILTPRERQVFILLVNGSTVKMIAEQLKLSHNTVHVHRARILKKLQCDTIIDLVHYAFRNQIIKN